MNHKKSALNLATNTIKKKHKSFNKTPDPSCMIEKITIVILSTFAVIVILDTMRKCYKQKEWFLFAVETVLLVAVVATIMLNT